MKLKFSQRLTDHLIQAIFIFASVYLAFWMTDRREHREQIRITQQAEKAILTELENNLRWLEEFTPAHQSIYYKKNEFYDNYLDTITWFDISLLPGYMYGFNTATLTNSAQGLINDPQVNLAIDKRMRLSRLYEEQKSVIKKTEKLDDFLSSGYALSKRSKKEAFILFYELLGSLWNIEDVHIKNIKSAIEVLKSDGV